MSAYIFWLSLAIACFGAEAIGISGIGLLFAGFGALTIGAYLHLAPELSELSQFAFFLVATALYAIILWKPLQKFRAPKSGGYQNIVGDIAYISGEGLTKGTVGEATWSGTIMKAKLCDSCTVDAVSGGSQATIVSVSGNTLVLKPQ